MQDIKETTATVAGLRGDQPVKAQGEGTHIYYPGRTLLVRESLADLLSERELSKHGWTTTLTDGHVQLTHASGRDIWGSLDGATGLYHLADSCYAAIASDPLAKAAANALRWHQRLGHASLDRVVLACSADDRINVNKWPSELPPCEVCIQAKMHKAPVNRRTTHQESDRALVPGERMDMDLIGPLPRSTGGNRWAVRFINRAMRKQAKRGLYLPRSPGCRRRCPHFLPRHQTRHHHPGLQNPGARQPAVAAADCACQLHSNFGHSCVSQS